MKLRYPHSKTATAFATLAISTLAFPTLILAQDDGEEVFTLSPFEVSPEEDQGYRASSSLAGSRLNTDLNDIASAVTVYTKELIDDLGATSEDEIMAYAASAVPELSDQAANVQGISIAFNGFQFRMRGQAATRTRNYFNSLLVPDTYNADRFDESRGPNAILFGIGGAGGILNVSTKTASTTENFGSLEFQFQTPEIGDHEKFRTHLDYNFAVNEKFALRLNALYENDNGWRPFERDDDERIHLAATYRFNEKAKLRAEYEKVNTETSLQRNFTGFDGVSVWLDAGSPVVDSGTGAVDPSNGIIRVPGPHRTVYISNDQSFRNKQGTVVTAGVAPNTDRFGQIFADTNVVPLDANFQGPGAVRFNDQESYSLFFDFQPIDNLYIELAYNHDESVSDIYDSLHTANTVYGEPGGTFRDGEANPYQGSYYIESRWVQRFFDQEIDNLRATATYQLDLGDKAGRHILAGLVSQEEQYTDRPVNFLTIGTNPPPFNNALAEAALNRIFTRTYIENPSDPASWAIASWEDIPSEISIEGIDGTFTPQWSPNELNVATTEVTSYLASVQSFFLNDRIVTTVGTRRDDFEEESFGVARNENGAFIRNEQGERTLSDTPTFSEETVDTLSFSAIGKVTDEVSLIYNNAESFQITSGFQRLVPNNEPLPNVNGTGEDIGFMLDLFEGKLFARIAYFETASIDRSSAFGVGSQVVARNERILDAQLAANEIDQAEYERRLGLVVGTDFDLTDRVTDGFEFNLTANPTNTWSIIFNAALTESVDSNMLKGTRESIAILRPLWESADQGLVTANNLTIAEEIDLYDQWFAEQTTVEGESTLGDREFQARLFTRYRFAEGALKGFYVGGGLRYSSAPIIGRSDATGELFKGEPLREMDLLFGYRKNVDWFGSEGQTLVFQLNANNLLQEEDYYSVRRTGAGLLNRAQVAIPTQYNFTTRIMF